MRKIIGFPARLFADIARSAGKDKRLPIISISCALCLAAWSLYAEDAAPGWEAGLPGWEAGLPGWEAGKPAPAAAASEARDAVAADVQPVVSPEPTTAEIVNQVQADKAAAEAAVSALEEQPSAEAIAQATSAIEKYRQSVLGLIRRTVPTEDKLEQCRAASLLAERIQSQAPDNAAAMAAAMAPIRETTTLLLSPREEARSRLEQAVKFFGARDYRKARDILSSYLEIPETSRECAGLLLRGLCLACLSYSEAAIRDWDKVRAWSANGRLARKAIWWTAGLRYKMGQKDAARPDLELLVQQYAPSLESGEAANLLMQLRKDEKAKAQ